jgi:hypothetical protein
MTKMNSFRLLGLLLLFLLSCSSKKEKMLCRRWQVTDVLFIHDTHKRVETDIKNDSAQLVSQTILRDILMKNIYEFHDDGTYITGNAAANSAGKWKLEGNAIRFILDNEKEQKEKIIPYEKLDQDSLILLMKNDQTSFQLKLVMVPMAQ